MATLRTFTCRSSTKVDEKGEVWRIKGDVAQTANFQAKPEASGKWWPAVILARSSVHVTIDGWFSKALGILMWGTSSRHEQEHKPDAIILQKCHLAVSTAVILPYAGHGVARVHRQNGIEEQSWA
ncbi:hypothetical protein [Glutamicibacter soli]